MDIKLASSNDRFTFQLKRYLERQLDKGLTPDNDPDTAAMADYFRSNKTEKEEKEKDQEWKVNNLEYDLRSTQWIVEKVKNSKKYSQHLYAAMCNNSFQKLDVVPILKNDKWSCSWRYAGGIIADMREEGDYIDWYCSGINFNNNHNGFVGESVVTDEIREDLKTLGWIVITDDNEYD